MSIRIKSVNINIEKTINHRIRNFEKENNIFKYLKKKIKPEFNVVDIYNGDTDLIISFSNLINREAFCISYIYEAHNAIKLREAANKKNVLIINSDFKNNDLKTAAADVVTAKDIILTPDNVDLFKEINRVLKQEGYFIIKEYLKPERIKKTSDSALVKTGINQFYSIVNNLQSKLRYVKNTEYEIYISGLSDFIYIGKGDLNKFYDFCDFLFEKSRKNDALMKEFVMIVVGTRGFKK